MVKIVFSSFITRKDKRDRDKKVQDVNNSDDDIRLIDWNLKSLACEASDYLLRSWFAVET